jgi:hypothetical protein
MARKRSRRSELKELLTSEEFATLSLGYSAARFLDEDGAAKEVRAKRNELGQRLWYNHPDEDTPPCFEVTGTVIEDDGESFELHLPHEKWCEDCQDYSQAAQEAFMAYWHRKYARQGLTAAYKKLQRFRGEL